MVTGETIEKIRAPQKVRPVRSPFVKLSESFITVVKIMLLEIGIVIA
jgi:hypothetical protein